MKIALLADIHGNAAALRAVLTSARTAGAEMILFAGDLVGYYYDPDESLDLLSAWKHESVRGNHDDMLADVVAGRVLEPDIRKRYGSGIAAATDVLSASQIQELADLPQRKIHCIAGKTILLAHGTPWDPGFYLYPDAPLATVNRCADEHTDYVVLGHTHYPFAARCDSTLVLNPGSVGQARGPGRGLAQWALLDTQSGEYRHEAIPYPTEGIIAEAKRRDPDVPYLHTILTRQNSA